MVSCPGLNKKMRPHPRSKVDAVACGNDIMAIGVRDAATRVLGKAEPETVVLNPTVR